MELRIQVMAIVASSLLLLGILELVRQRRLLERYALLWLFCALILLALAIWRDFLETIANAVGIIYPPNALFLIAFGFVMLLLLHFSMAVSRLADQSKVLAQRIARLEERQSRGDGGRADQDQAEQDEPVQDEPVPERATRR